MWRICSQCGLRTDDEVCPDDGVSTEQIRSHTEFPGRLQNGYMLRDQYRIEGLVGVGGMGVVYKAVHSITHQPVAIKVLWRDLADNPQEVRRFTREARAASILTHPNTVRVYDFGRDERSDSIYMVMEFLVGRKLSDLLAETPVIAPTQAVHITAQVCKSLEEAHAKGIVHRDLKPDNIFLQDVAGEKDFVKVLDFGLAKFVTGNFERDNLTKTGYVVGSPEYMAPEQAIGSNVGPAADLYSVGILLYEILTGDLPFDAVSTAQVLRKHIMDRVPDMPVGIRSNIPSKLEAVVLRCLEKDPADRPPSAEVLRIHLLQAQDRRRRGPSPSETPDDGPVDTQETAKKGRVAVEAPGAIAGTVLHEDGTGTDLSPRSKNAQVAPSPQGGAVDSDRVNPPPAIHNGHPLPSGPKTTRQPAGRMPDNSAGSPVSDGESLEDGEAPVSGWMLVGIGVAAAGAVLIAALLLK